MIAKTAPKSDLELLCIDIVLGLVVEGLDAFKQSRLESWEVLRGALEQSMRDRTSEGAATRSLSNSPVCKVAVILTYVVNVDQQSDTVFVQHRYHVVVVIMVGEVAQKFLKDSSTVTK